jgi:hypothetical protein
LYQLKILYPLDGASRQSRQRPSHEGQEKAEDEKFAYWQMLVRIEAFGIHYAGEFGFIFRLC